MRRTLLLGLISILSLGLVLAACSSDDDSDGDTTPGSSETAQPTSSDATEALPDATSDDGSSSGSGDVSVEFTGALEASWGDDSIATCTSFSGQLNVSISGIIGSETYSLAVTQQTYTPGAYFLPESGQPDSGVDPAIAPAAQLVTPSDASLQWDMGTGVGEGSISLGGGTADVPLLLTVDGDLADKNGGAPVHVVADVTCDVTIS